MDDIRKEECCWFVGEGTIFSSNSRSNQRLLQSIPIGMFCLIFASRSVIKNTFDERSSRANCLNFWVVARNHVRRHLLSMKSTLTKFVQAPVITNNLLVNTQKRFCRHLHQYSRRTSKCDVTNQFINIFLNCGIWSHPDQKLAATVLVLLAASHCDVLGVYQLYILTYDLGGSLDDLFSPA